MIKPLFALLFASCAMSEAALDDLYREVEARNAARAETSAAALRAEGYRLADTDPDLFTLFVEHGAGHCGEPPASVGVQLVPSAEGSPRLDARADGAALCAFLSGRQQALDLEGPAGSIAVRRLHGRFARGRDGAPVQILYDAEVVERREVLVERSCNLMPSPAPDPLEMASPVAVVRAAEPLREVRARLEREELDVRCTDNVY